MSKTIVIGGGFAGLAAACHLAKGGAEVHLVERHDQLGGRARTWVQDGFTFDLGPSWYWMPDVFERFFGAFGHEVSDFYELVRLDPSYRVVWPGGEHTDQPADLDALRAQFEAREPGAAAALDRFLAETGEVYAKAMGDYLLRPSLSLAEYADPRLLGDVTRLRMLRSMARYARTFFKDERNARLVEWPVLFLGASAKKTSAMYSLMSHADIQLGTWYPLGGMHKIIEGMAAVAQELGVHVHLGQRVQQIVVEGGRARGVSTVDGELFDGDAVIAAADYHHVEQQLLAPEHRQYSPRYWQRRTMSPSSLLFYIGLDGADLGGLPHHTLFFDEDLDTHMDAVYRLPRWPARPLFYACAPSVTDPSVAPDGCSNLFILVPLAPGLNDVAAARERAFVQVMERLEAHTGKPIRGRIRFRRSYAMKDFVADYGAFKGNAYGLANTLAQTGPLKPRMKSSKVDGLYYAGQLTVPGPGMPPSLVSGELAAGLVLADS